MKVLLTGAYKYSDHQISLLKNIGWKVDFIQNEKETIKIPVNEFDAVVCNALFLYNDISQFKKLKMVQVTSAGLERLPVKYMNENDIVFFNAKDVYSVPMAEWVILNVLELYKDAYGFFCKQKKKRWEKNYNLLEMSGKKACIIGYGSVGKEIAKRLSVFGSEIVVINRTEVREEYIQKWISLDEMDIALRDADIVILSIALTKETMNIIDARRMGIMKKDSILINVSRGAILDQAALSMYLKKDKFKGVALDVFTNEPLSEDDYLWECPRVIITPHNSFVSDKTRERMFDVIYNNLKKFGEI